MWLKKEHKVNKHNNWLTSALPPPKKVRVAEIMQRSYQVQIHNIEKFILGM